MSDSSAPAWAADIDVSENLVCTLVSEQFDHLRNLPVRRFAEGWDNVVFTVGDEWLMRLPRRRRAVEGVQREMRCLPFIVAAIPVPVPAPTLQGSASQAYPWPFFGYRKLPGAEACDFRPTREHRFNLAQPIASVLRTLHASPELSVIRDSLPLDIRRIASTERRTWGEARLQALHELREDLPYDKLNSFLAAVGAMSGDESETTVVHGDLHFRHLLIAPDGELSGLIDWGKLHVGNPAIDLQIYWSFFPPEARTAFVDAYGGVGRGQLTVARAVAVWLNAVLLEHALHRGLTAVAVEARMALHNIATGPPAASATQA